MKCLSLLFLFFSSVSWAGHLGITKEGDDPNAVATVHLGSCYQAQAFSYIVVRKLDKTHYELAGDLISPHAILITTGTEFLTSGRLNLVIEPVGHKNLPLENGFTETYDVWKECKRADPPSRAVHPASIDSGNSGKTPLRIQENYNPNQSLLKGTIFERDIK